MPGAVKRDKGHDIRQMEEVWMQDRRYNDHNHGRNRADGHDRRGPDSRLQSDIVGGVQEQGHGDGGN